MAIGPGTRVGPYEIRSLLGAGGMGEVFLAHDARLGRDVAVKILPARLLMTPIGCAGSRSRRGPPVSSTTPNILAIFDIGAEAGQPYVVSERLEGETLRGRLSRGAIAEREALEIARQVARGLASSRTLAGSCTGISSPRTCFSPETDTSRFSTSVSRNRARSGDWRRDQGGHRLRDRARSRRGDGAVHGARSR